MYLGDERGLSQSNYELRMSSFMFTYCGNNLFIGAKVAIERYGPGVEIRE